jgi:hypothetical protein
MQRPPDRERLNPEPGGVEVRGTELVPPEGFEPTAPGLGIPRRNLSPLTSADLSLESRDSSPDELTPNDARLAGLGHLVGTTPEAPEASNAPEITDTKDQPQDLISRGGQKAQ